MGDFFASFDKQNTKSEFHIYIADLSDEKKHIEKQRFPVTVIPDSNLGYAHGVNEGLKNALADGYYHFCIVNSDIFVDSKFTDSVLFSNIKHPASIIGGKIYYAAGYEYHKSRYAPNELGKVLWYAGGIIDWNHALAKHIGVDEVGSPRHDKFGETRFVNGCCMCFDKTVLDTVGFWDESYFLYYEDADFCERAKKKSIPLYFDPSIILWHKNAQSTGGSGSLIHLKYQEKNRLKFGLKYAPLKTKIHLIKNFFFSVFK